MTEPAETAWPPKAFTPSILGWESRPFRVEPPPFFCAMVSYFLMMTGSGVDRADLQFGVRLAMAAMLLVVLTAAHLEDAHLVVPAMRQHCRLDGCTPTRACRPSTPRRCPRPAPDRARFPGPTSAAICSTLIFSPAATLYCLPPVFMTAYILPASRLTARPPTRTKRSLRSIATSRAAGRRVGLSLAASRGRRPGKLGAAHSGRPLSIIARPSANCHSA